MTFLRDIGDISTCKIGFVGAGRIGKALAWSLEAHGCNVHAAASRTPDSVAGLTQGTRACLALSAQDVANACDLIFVTTPDALIQPTVEAIRWRAGSGVVHCSGATEVSSLAKAAGDGALIGGFHPMQTFGDPQAAVHSLPGCVITIEADEDLHTLLVGLADRLGCQVNQLPPGARARYHAAAGYASQYINVLLSEAVRIWLSWGASESAALKALLPVVRGTVSSIESAGVAKGMPGPVSRGDAGTVAKQLRSLMALDDATASLYRELCRRSVPLAEQAGGLDPATAREIRMLLDS